MKNGMAQKIWVIPFFIVSHKVKPFAHRYYLGSPRILQPVLTCSHRSFLPLPFCSRCGVLLKRLAARGRERVRSGTEWRNGGRSAKRGTSEAEYRSGCTENAARA